MNINNNLIWDNIDWNEINLFINKIQSRIVKASLNKNWKLIKDLQRLLVNSYYAKLLAVKRVTSNKGKKTPGVDNVILRTGKEKYELAISLNRGKYKPKPLRRIHIKKKNGKIRPLGIPTMYDRAMQALYLMALEPVVETLADKTSFGFRKGRSCADAREQLFINYSRKTSPKWILEGDIKGCFDNISHDWLIDNVPMDKSILRSFLKAGFIHNGFRFSTDNGTPQGGIISPCLANFTLDGIDKLLKDNFKRHKNEGRKRAKVHLIRYADDFIITAGTKEIAIKAKALVKEFLADRGLELSDEKTLITNIDEGADFLGWNIRKYNSKLLIKPSTKSIKSVISKLRDVINSNKSIHQDLLIAQLNPIITGWSNYHQGAVSKRIFQKVDHIIYLMLWKWCKRRHPNKGNKWVKSRYFKSHGNRNWIFGDTLTLKKMSDKNIIRHHRLKLDKNPFIDLEYFKKRKYRMGCLKLSGNMKKLWIKQKGYCPLCNESMDIAEDRRMMYTDNKSDSKDKISKMIMVHKDCMKIQNYKERLA